MSIESSPSGRGSPSRSVVATLLATLAVLVVLGGMTMFRGGRAAPTRASAASGVQPPTTPKAPSEPQTVAPAKPSTEAAPEIRFGIAAPPPKPPKSFRLATYNTENLFDAVDDPKLTGQYEDLTSIKPESALEGLAAAIHTLNADVLAMEEIESEQVLLWFRDKYLKDMGYVHHASIDAGDPRGIEQSVLSRYPISGVQNWPDAPLVGVHPADAPDVTPGTPIHFHRSPLKVDVEVPAKVTGGKAYTFTLVVVHHKSGRKSGYWREAEAVRTAEIVKSLEAEKPGRNIAVLGDFNSVPTDAAVSAYLTSGLIDLFAPRATGDLKVITHESGRSIDYILVNPALRAEVVPNSAFVLGTPAKPDGVDWRTHPSPSGYGSDHYPVAVDVRYVEGK